MKRLLFIILNFTFLFAGAQTLYRVNAVAVDNNSKEVSRILHIEKSHIAGFEAILKVRDQISQRLLENAYYLSMFDSLSLDTTKLQCTLYYQVGKQYKWLQLKPGNCNGEALSKAGYHSRKFSAEPFSAAEIEILFEKIISFYEVMVILLQ